MLILWKINRKNILKHYKPNYSQNMLDLDFQKSEFMKGSGMKELNEKFPQMKMFAESLERIQKMGGLPSFGIKPKQSTNLKQKVKKSVQPFILKRYNIDLSKLLTHLEDPGWDEIEREASIREKIELVDSWQNPLSSDVLAALRMLLIYHARSSNELNHSSIALKFIERAEEIIDYESEFEQSQPNSLLLFEKGIAYKKQKYYSNAVKVFNNIIENTECGSDVYLRALIFRAQCYYSFSEFSKALMDVNEYLCYNNDDAFARLDRSSYCFHSDPALAQRDIEYAIDDTTMIKHLPECYYRLGILHISQKKYKLALDALERLEKLNPKHEGLEIARQYSVRELKESNNSIPKENVEKYRELEKNLKTKNSKLKELATSAKKGQVLARDDKEKLLTSAIDSALKKKEQEILLQLKRKGVSVNSS